MAVKVIHFLVGRPKPESTNGVVKAVYFLTKYEKKYVDVEVWCISSKKSPGEYMLDSGVKCRVFPKNLLKFSSWVKSLLRPLTNQKIVFHIHGIFSPYYWLLGFFLWKYDLKYMVSPHGSLNQYALSVSKWKKELVKPLVLLFLKKSLILRALSPLEGEQMLKYGIPQEKVKLVPNGVEKSDILHKRLSPEKKIFLFMGRLDIKVKGIDLLLESFKLALRKGLVGELWLAGPDFKGGRAFIQKFLSENPWLKKNIKILGPVMGAPKEDIYERVNFFIQLSRTEALSLGVLEALSKGLPVIASEAVDSLGIIRKEDCGFIAGQAPEYIAKVLLTAANLSFEEWRAMSERARKATEEHFSWDKISRKMAEIYEEYA